MPDECVCCFHLLGPPYGVQGPGGETVPAVGEACCHCGRARVRIRTTRPEGIGDHGPYLLFVEPNPSAAPPAPGLFVPGRPRIVH